MRPDLKPISSKDRQLLQLFTYNGVGRTLLGFTRPDRAGGRYATVWEVAFGMPLFPLGRFYLFGGSTSLHTSNVFSIKTNYRFVGKTRIKLTEVLRTYVWGWLMCPAATALPIWLLIELFQVIDWQNTEPVLLALALGLVWLALLIALPLGASMGMMYLRVRYQRIYE
jgi:hypothetical protein